MDVNKIKAELDRAGADAKKDVNEAVSDVLTDMHRGIVELTRSARALPREAAVALENVTDGLWRSAQAILAHHVSIHDGSVRDVEGKS